MTNTFNKQTLVGKLQDALGFIFEKKLTLAFIIDNWYEDRLAQE